MTKAATIKPFKLQEFQDEVTGKVPEVKVNQWQGILLANIEENDEWTALIVPGGDAIWESKKTEHRGFAGGNAERSAKRLNQLLQYIAQYAPGCLYRDITGCALSLAGVWKLIRTWAGLKSRGNYHQSYSQVRASFKNNPEQSPVNFFYKLRNAKKDCLLQ